MDDCWEPKVSAFSYQHLLGFYDDDDGDDDEYTNMTSAFCSFYSYTPHFPSPPPSFLPSFLSQYTLIVIITHLPELESDKLLRSCYIVAAIVWIMVTM